MTLDLFLLIQSLLIQRQLEMFLVKFNNLSSKVTRELFWLGASDTIYF